jgi:hypothetical protein
MFVTVIVKLLVIVAVFMVLVSIMRVMIVLMMRMLVLVSGFLFACSLVPLFPAGAPGERRLLTGVACSLFYNHVDFRARQAAAHHRVFLKPRAKVQRGRSPGQQLEADSSIHKRAQQHIAADARKALKISNSHRVVILNG